VDNASGAFTLDNLTFESMGDPDLPDDPDPPAAAVFSCDGFKSHRSHWGHHSGFLWAKLLDEDGVEVGIQDLDSPPRAHVAFAPADGEDAHDVTEHVVWGDGSFFFTRRGNWAVFQKPWRMRRAGTYMTTMETGDPDEYVLDPTCVEYFEKKHRRHRRHRHDRR